MPTDPIRVPEAPLIDGTPPPLKVRPDVLSTKQLNFITAWLEHGNGAKAARTAGYSISAAAQEGARLLRIPAIKAEIERRNEVRAQRFAVTAERVLNQLARMAFVDPRDYVDCTGAMIPLHQLSDEAAAALQGLEVDQGLNGKTKTRYKLVDRGAAVDKLMRHLGLFERDNTHAVDAVGQLLASIHSAGSRIGMKK